MKKLYWILGTLLGLILLTYGLLNLHEEDILSRGEVLAQEGILFQAELLSKKEWETPHDGTAYDMTYFYRVDDLNWRITDTTYDRTIFDRYAEGDLIPILYHPDNPRTSALADEEVISNPPDIDPIGVAITALGGLLLLGSIGFLFVFTRTKA